MMRNVTRNGVVKKTDREFLSILAEIRSIFVGFDFLIDVASQ